MVSGAINMAGKLGSFVTGLAIPHLADSFGSHLPFFFVAAGLNVATLLVWRRIDPQQEFKG